MSFRRRLCARAVRAGLSALVLAVAGAARAPAQDEGFPFDRELLLDARPMKGGKRVPVLEVAPDGRGTIDLWCDSAEVQAVIVGETITLLLGAVRQQPCTPERARADADMTAALAEVTHWRREGDALVLAGGRTLRFRPATN